jgi:hypothetical protein
LGYSYIGGQDIDIAIGVFPISITFAALPPIQAGDLIVLSFFVSGTWALLVDIWSGDVSDNQTMLTYSDTLQGIVTHAFDFAGGNPADVPHTTVPGAQQFSGFTGYSVTVGGNTSVTVALNPQIAAPHSKTTYSSAVFSAAVYRGITPIVPAGYDIGVANYTSLDAPLTDEADVTPSISPAPNVLIGTITPGSGAASGAWISRGAGVIVDMADDAGNPGALIVPGVAGMLWVTAFSASAAKPARIILPANLPILHLPFCIEGDCNGDTQISGVFS